jgi:hypothetical protein
MRTIIQAKRILVTGILCLLMATWVFGEEKKQRAPQVEMCLEVSPVWSGHPVGFFLLTKGNRQYAAFYDQQRRMTVAMRTLASKKWNYHRLDSVIGWDSHNYITMAIDGDGYIHLSGNMHCDPLVYFRTTKRFDIHSFQRVSEMVGRQENRCTYPKFIRGANEELIFTYRDGGSGNGNQIYNVYDLKTKAWRRLLDTPLMDGQGKMNAYIVGPVRGPDGYFHICWVWRDTPNCYTNHDLSYARSKDMKSWETITGERITLPMTIDTEGLIVDPVPVKGGMINGNTRIGFDSKKRPVISYHKFDKNGVTQIYNARLESGRWKIYQTSDWNYRWYFQGGGTIHFEIRVFGVVLEKDGSLTQSYRHDKYGAGIWKLDENTLKPTGEMEKEPAWPRELNKLESDFAGMQVKWSKDAGEDGDSNVEYLLRWETLGVNRDRRRATVPKPSMLRLYKLRYNSG